MLSVPPYWGFSGWATAGAPAMARALPTASAVRPRLILLFVIVRLLSIGRVDPDGVLERGQRLPRIRGSSRSRSASPNMLVA